MQDVLASTVENGGGRPPRVVHDPRPGAAVEHPVGLGPGLAGVEAVLPALGAGKGRAGAHAFAHVLRRRPELRPPGAGIPGCVVAVVGDVVAVLVGGEVFDDLAIGRRRAHQHDRVLGGDIAGVRLDRADPLHLAVGREIDGEQSQLRSVDEGGEEARPALQAAAVGGEGRRLVDADHGAAAGGEGPAVPPRPHRPQARRGRAVRRDHRVADGRDALSGEGRAVGEVDQRPGGRGGRQRERDDRRGEEHRHAHCWRDPTGGAVGPAQDCGMRAVGEPERRRPVSLARRRPCLLRSTDLRPEEERRDDGTGSRHHPGAHDLHGDVRRRAARVLTH
jgi:hypothetical protein